MSQGFDFIVPEDASDDEAAAILAVVSSCLLSSNCSVDKDGDISNPWVTRHRILSRK